MSDRSPPFESDQTDRLAQDATRRLDNAELSTERETDEFGRSQRWISVLIISLYVGVIVLIVLAYFAASLFSDNQRVITSADKARDLANTLVLPIVTLVLGYYFGKRAE